MTRVYLLLLALVFAADAGAVERPAFDPQIGARLDLGRTFRDESGAQSTLSGILAGRPALVVFGYDKCPNLCGVTQQAVAADLRKTGLDPSTYRALFISIDATETANDAAGARAQVASVTDAAGLSAWRFLTSADGNAGALAAQAGIGFDRRPRIDQYVHPIAVLALTPDGRIAQVLPALSFEPRDLRLALVEASAGRLGSIADHVFLLCAGFDATKGQYTPAIWAAVKIGAVMTTLALGALLLALRRGRGA
ncbi:SCO family protein [Mesorhizobium sp. SP-1A]|uniref:SCO family protein n=1 Tax=Mesorhizobium sp. SP-1A TaxID=3077840 RepID=UPI0028F6F778|nr:SCO family protein [Mesorhizobium sp. SP-1A]